MMLISVSIGQFCAQILFEYCLILALCKSSLLPYLVPSPLHSLFLLCFKITAFVSYFFFREEIGRGINLSVHKEWTVCLHMLHIVLSHCNSLMQNK